MGLVAPQRVGSSQTRDRTHVPCIGREILNYWTTREVPKRILRLIKGKNLGKAWGNFADSKELEVLRREMSREMLKREDLGAKPRESDCVS